MSIIAIVHKRFNILTKWVGFLKFIFNPFEYARFISIFQQ